MAQASPFDDREPVDDDAEESDGPPLRIRHLLLFGMIAAAGWWAYPRALAAWNLHDKATHIANYALCMGGPTGPTLLRDNPAEFRQLVRRRLVAAGATERPFERCAELALAITGSAAVERAHLSQSWAFEEYGRPTQVPGSVNLDELKISTKPLAKLAKQAWPFVRGGYTRLVKPSTTAKGAPHPVKPAKAALGHGLPAWRSAYRSARQRGPESYLLAVGSAANLSVYATEDNGVSWTSAAVNQPGVSDFAERCVGNEHRAFALGISDDGQFLTVTSTGPDGPPFTAAIAPASRQVFSAACDDKAYVLATRPEEGRDVKLHLCRYRQACKPMNTPMMGSKQTAVQFPLDVARVQGVTVVALPMGHVTRVASSRDDGVSWTPFAVAFDAHAEPQISSVVKQPSRLLKLGDQLLLYGGAPRPDATYPVLVSDDFGASWKTP